MNFRPARTLLAVPLIALLAACGSAGGTPLSGSAGSSGPAASSAPAASSGSATSSGSASGSRAADAPPSEATMVCGPEVEDRLKTLLAVPKVPAGESTWRDGVFTCTYPLSDGPLVLKVTVLPDNAAAKAKFATQKAAQPGAATIKGLASLGLPSYQSPSGVVGFAKDNFTFSADASRMSAKVGPDGRSRTDFAYGIAATVLACWTE